MPAEDQISNRATISRVHDVFVYGLALISVALLAAIPVVIIYDAALRVLRLGASIWAIDFTAIALVYITFLGSPWLLRTRGHVYVGVLLDFLKPSARLWFGRMVCIFCTIICLMLAYRSVDLVVANIGQYDVSAIDTPRWIRFAPLPVGFFFVATEFVRILFSSELLHPTHGSPEL